MATHGTATWDCLLIEPLKQPAQSGETGQAFFLTASHALTLTSYTLWTQGMAILRQILRWKGIYNILELDKYFCTLSYRDSDACRIYIVDYNFRGIPQVQHWQQYLFHRSWINYTVRGRKSRLQSVLYSWTCILMPLPLTLFLVYEPPLDHCHQLPNTKPNIAVPLGYTSVSFCLPWICNFIWDLIHVHQAFSLPHI